VEQHDAGDVVPAVVAFGRAQDLGDRQGGLADDAHGLADKDRTVKLNHSKYSAIVIRLHQM